MEKQVGRNQAVDNPDNRDCQRRDHSRASGKLLDTEAKSDNHDECTQEGHPQVTKRAVCKLVDALQGRLEGDRGACKYELLSC